MFHPPANPPHEAVAYLNLGIVPRRWMRGAARRRGGGGYKNLNSAIVSYRER